MKWLRILSFAVAAFALTGGASAQESSVTLTLSRTIGRGIIYDVVFSPDESLVAVATPTGVYLHELDKPADEPHHIIADIASRKLAFNPQGDKLALLLAQDIAVYDFAADSLLYIPRRDLDPYQREEDSSDTLAFSPDGTRILHGEWGVLFGPGEQGDQIYGYDAAIGEQVVAHTFEGSVRTFISEDGTSVIAQRLDSVEVWRFEPELKQVAVWPTPIGRYGAPVGIIVSGDGSTIVIRNAAQEVLIARMGDVAFAPMEIEIYEHAYIALNGDGTRLLVSESGESLSEWDIVSNRLLGSDRIYYADALKYSRSGQNIVAWSTWLGRDLYMRETGSSANIIITSYSTSWWTSDVSPDEKLLMVREWPELIRILDVTSGEQIASCGDCIDIPDDELALFWPDSHRILITRPGHALITDATFIPRQTLEFTIDRGMAGNLLLFEDGESVAVINQSGTIIEFYDFDDWQLIHWLKSRESINTQAIAPDGARIALEVSDDGDYLLRIQDVATRDIVHERSIVESGTLRFNPDGRLLVNLRGSYQTSFYLGIYDTVTWTKTAQLMFSARCPVPSFAFSADSNLLAVASGGVLQILETNQWQVLTSVPFPCGYSTLEFAGDSLVAAMNDGYALVYDVARE